MWGRLKQFLGVIPDFTDSEEVIRALHGDVVKRNFLFHIFIIMFECVMVISISMRPGGPFAKPRRVTYFVLYLVLILAAAGVTWLEAWIDRKRQADFRLYFRAEAAFLAFFSLWGVAVTLNDQLGGNGLTVYNYVVLIPAIMSMMKPWQAAFLFLADFILLNGLLPCFPDPAGLDNSFNNLMNSLFSTLAAAAIAASLYNSKLQAKRNEIIIKMAEKGIACNVHYKPLPMLTAYKNLEFDIENYPNAYKQYKNQITLPLYSKLDKTDIDYIITCFKEILKACGCY